ncbi:MAG: dTMP kinase, partial [Treponema sp.]|nr:dTMP kinase [Treponema sp.]
QDFPLPEILFFFDIDPEISLKRVLGRGQTEIYEKLDFQKATAERYRAVIAEYEKMNTGMKIIRLDASKSVEEIAGIIAKEIS